MSFKIGRSDGEVKDLFTELAAQWVKDTGLESNVERMVLHPAYQRIIGLGPQVVPIVLAEMGRAPNHWFWALMALVGEDKAADETSVSGATEKWLAWGRECGLVTSQEDESQ